MTAKTLLKHIRYRLTRAKTYVALIMAALVAAQPYLVATPYADAINYALAVCAALVAFIGGSKDADTGNTSA